jgi:hypothetical protein
MLSFLNIKLLLLFVNLFLILLILIFLPSAEMNSYGEFFGSPKSENRLLSSLIWFLIFAYLILGLLSSQVFF